MLNIFDEKYKGVSEKLDRALLFSSPIYRLLIQRQEEIMSKITSLAGNELSNLERSVFNVRQGLSEDLGQEIIRVANEFNQVLASSDPVIPTDEEVEQAERECEESDQERLAHKKEIDQLIKDENITVWNITACIGRSGKLE